MQQERVAALLGRPLAPDKVLPRVRGRGQTSAPGFDRERRVRHHAFVGAQVLALLELWGGQCVARQDAARREIVRIMFMRAKPAVVTSIFWLSRVIYVPACVATFSGSEPEPQVGSWAVGDALAWCGPMPSTLAMTRLTRLGV